MHHLGRRTAPHVPLWALALGILGAAVFVGAFFAGRATAPGPAAAAALQPAAASHTSLGLGPLSQASPLPPLAARPQPQIRIRTVSTPAPHRKRRGPVEIVGSG